VAEMRMLRWICGHTRRDRVRNDDIRERVGVAPIEEKLMQHRLRWFGHIQRRPEEAPVHIGIIRRLENVKRGRGRPTLTWTEAVKRDLKEWNIDKELVVDSFAFLLNRLTFSCAHLDLAGSCGFYLFYVFSRFVVFRFSFAFVSPFFFGVEL
jgi:hypothetical protein